LVKAEVENKVKVEAEVEIEIYEYSIIYKPINIIGCHPELAKDL
jgi:hypothetical protein